MKINKKAIKDWVVARRFEQPYESEGMPEIVMIRVLEEIIWLNLSSGIEPRYFNNVADQAIAAHFAAVGRNEIRNGLNGLLKREELTFAQDPTDLSY